MYGNKRPEYNTCYVKCEEKWAFIFLAKTIQRE